MYRKQKQCLCGDKLLITRITFFDASLKVISRYQQWLHYHYNIL